MQRDKMIGEAVRIAASYVTHNSLRAVAMPSLIRTIHLAIAGLGREAVVSEAHAVKLTPAQIRRSIT